MKQLAITLFFIAASFSLVGQPTGKASRLNSIKNNVQFEIQQKEDILQTCNKLDLDMKLLLKPQPGDAEILEAMTLNDVLGATIDKINTANERQALLMEEITTLLGNESSAQEQMEYRKCKLALTEISNVQKQLIARTKDMGQKINSYLQKLPAPPILQLSCGLQMKLIGSTADSPAFYASQPITHTLYETITGGETSTQAQENPPPANPNLKQALDFARKLSRQERMTLTLPSQAQLTAMGKFQATPRLAIWSSEAFSTKNSLAKQRNRLGRNQNALEKQQLTPAQTTAVARFKIPFQLIWDPCNLLSDTAFCRELPHATHKSLGMIIVAPVKYGLQQRMDKLATEHKKATSAKD